MQYKYKHIIARNLHFVNDANYICRHFVPAKSEGQHHNMFLWSGGLSYSFNHHGIKTQTIGLIVCAFTYIIIAPLALFSAENLAIKTASDTCVNSSGVCPRCCYGR